MGGIVWEYVSTIQGVLYGGGGVSSQLWSVIWWRQAIYEGALCIGGGKHYTGKHYVWWEGKQYTGGHYLGGGTSTTLGHHIGNGTLWRHIQNEGWALYMEMLYRETRTTQGHYISGAASTMLGLLYRRGRKYGGTFYRSSEHCMRGLRSSSPTPLTLTIHIPQCHIPTALGHLQGQVTPPLPGQLCHCLTSLSENKLFLTPNLNLPTSPT